MRVVLAGLTAVMIAGGAQASETPMQFVPPREPPALRPMAQQPPAVSPQETSAGDRLRAVLGRPADCPPEPAAKTLEPGV